MIVADRFVYLHLHKSGGTFVNEGLLRFASGARHVGYHLPYRLVPPECTQLPVLGFVRNPWSYYVSWYAFQAGRAQPNPLFRVLSEDGRLDFETTVRNMVELGSGGEHLDALIAALPAGYRNRGLNLPGYELAAIRDSGLGFYSFLHEHIFGGAPIRHVGRMENLRQEIVKMLMGVGQSIGPAMQAYFAGAPASNASGHAPHATYYSPALRDLVARRDANVIERYGYRFEE